MENGFGAAWIHHQQHEVRRLATQLKAEAPSFEGHHGGSAPGSREMLTGATHHGTAPVAASENESSFEHGGEDDDALGLVQQILGDVVGDVHNFLYNGAAVLEPAGFSLVIRRGEWQSD